MNLLLTQINTSINKTTEFGGQRPLDALLKFMNQQSNSQKSLWFGLDLLQSLKLVHTSLMKNVSAVTYQDLLSKCGIPALKSKRRFSATIFQQDRARPHTAGTTRDLKKHFDDQWRRAKGDTPPENS